MAVRHVALLLLAVALCCELSVSAAVNVPRVVRASGNDKTATKDGAKSGDCKTWRHQPNVVVIPYAIAFLLTQFDACVILYMLVWKIPRIKKRIEHLKAAYEENPHLHHHHHCEHEGTGQPCSCRCNGNCELNCDDPTCAGGTNTMNDESPGLTNRKSPEEDETSDSKRQKTKTPGRKPKTSAFGRNRAHFNSKQSGFVVDKKPEDHYDNPGRFRLNSPSKRADGYYGAVDGTEGQDAADEVNGSKRKKKTRTTRKNGVGRTGGQDGADEANVKTLGLKTGVIGKSGVGGTGGQDAADEGSKSKRKRTRTTRKNGVGGTGGADGADGANVKTLGLKTGVIGKSGVGGTGGADGADGANVKTLGLKTGVIGKSGVGGNGGADGADGANVKAFELKTAAIGKSGIGGTGGQDAVGNADEVNGSKRKKKTRTVGKNGIGGTGGADGAEGQGGTGDAGGANVKAFELKTAAIGKSGIGGTGGQDAVGNAAEGNKSQRKKKTRTVRKNDAGGTGGADVAEGQGDADGARAVSKSEVPGSVAFGLGYDPYASQFAYKKPKKAPTKIDPKAGKNDNGGGIGGFFARLFGFGKNTQTKEKANGGNGNKGAKCQTSPDSFGFQKCLPGGVLHAQMVAIMARPDLLVRLVDGTWGAKGPDGAELHKTKKAQEAEKKSRKRCSPTEAVRKPRKKKRTVEGGAFVAAPSYYAQHSMHYQYGYPTQWNPHTLQMAQQRYGAPYPTQGYWHQPTMLPYPQPVVLPYPATCDEEHIIMARDSNDHHIFTSTEDEPELFLLALKAANACFVDGDEARRIVKYIGVQKVISPSPAVVEQLDILEPYLTCGIGLLDIQIEDDVADFVCLLYNNGLLKVIAAPGFICERFDLRIKSDATTSCRRDDDAIRSVVNSRYYKIVRFAKVSRVPGPSGMATSVLMIQKDETARKILSLMPCKIDPWDVPELLKEFHKTIAAMEDLSEDRHNELYCSFLDSLRVHSYKKEYTRVNSKLGVLESISDGPHLCYYKRLFQKKKEVDMLKCDIQRIVGLSCIPYLSPCRIIHVKNGLRDYGYGVALDLAVTYNKQGEPTYFVKTAIFLAKDPDGESTHSERIRPYSWVKNDGNVEVSVVMLKWDYINTITTVSVRTPADLTSAKSRRKLFEIMQNCINSYNVHEGKGLPEVDPIKDMKIENNELRKLIREKNAKMAGIAESPLTKRKIELDEAMRLEADKEYLTRTLHELKQKYDSAIENEKIYKALIAKKQ
ncbi:hypothetical protein QR680_012327 [Steinernema hermaphroditum]|uniref:Exosome RNA helicase MTR4-like beta-barrel domain-containing protein n=1 Tax=Steinernema hermaphroditum TaxID=289476 RepID=A0AA39I478_9BILA|nr:hypothetical protein QR680_012327 [Steinernema hermaphroditum]